MKITDFFDKNTFVLSSEIEPPKGTDIEKFINTAESLKNKVHFFNVTDQQGAVMHAGSLTGCTILKNKNMEPIFQLACRDRNRIALQSDLLSAAISGLENVLIITGDHPHLGDHPDARAVFDLDSVQLLQAASKLMEGTDMAGNNLNKAPSFCLGAAVNPGADNLDLELIKVEKKVRAGAKFFQTQAVFDPERFNDFMDRMKEFNTPVMAGIVILKSSKMARFMNEKIAGINVPEEIIKRMEKTEDKKNESVEIAASIIRNIRSRCQGIHFMPLGWDNLVPHILEKAGLTI
ncbi:MAG: methylenetetrahydrofolate reductase [Candidatus Schekmanbacteria bacterium]|nr:methylenetetrahydrofolate reductase [Candidatus Schekmanbacteria bacterium]